jgi:hypothetical protein
MNYAMNAMFDDANVLASSLLEGVYTVSANTVAEIDKFMSMNYMTLNPLALALKSQRDNMQSALSQMDLRLAQGKWLDYWGDLFNVSRSALDFSNDNYYRYRLEAETSGQKATNVGMEELLSAVLNRDVSIVDGGKPFSLSGTYGRASGIGIFTAGSSQVIITPLVTRLQGAYRTKAVENIDAGTITDLFFPQQRIYTTIVNNILPSPLTSPTTIVSVPAAGGYTVGYYTLSQASLKTDAATVAAVFVSSGDHMATSTAYTPGTISGTITTTSFNATVSFNGLAPICGQITGSSLSLLEFLPSAL